jgi:hypothetical protein
MQCAKDQKHREVTSKLYVTIIPAISITAEGITEFCRTATMHCAHPIPAVPGVTHTINAGLSTALKAVGLLRLAFCPGLIERIKMC